MTISALRPQRPTHGATPTIRVGAHIFQFVPDVVQADIASDHCLLEDFDLGLKRARCQRADRVNGGVNGLHVRPGEDGIRCCCMTRSWGTAPGCFCSGCGRERSSYIR